MTNRFFIAAGLVVLALPATVPGQGTDQAVIEEILVTATKREASIQDVPIAVSAYTGEDLAGRGVTDLQGLQEVSPSVAVYNSNSTSNGGTLRIRGVGTTGNNPGLEAAVGTFIDGVYRSRAGLAFDDLVDIDRVEVLRGPQGTLFGKNTIAGAVNVITRKPAFENGADVTLGLGNLNSREAAFAGNAVLADEVLAGRLSLAYRNRDGGYRDIDSGDTYDRQDRRYLRGQLLWTPNDDLEIRVIGDYTRKEESCCPASFWIPGPTSAIIAALGGDTTPFALDQDARVGVNYPPFENVRNRGLSLDVSWEPRDGMTFRSITATLDFEISRGQGPRFHQRRHPSPAGHRRGVPELFAGVSAVRGNGRPFLAVRRLYLLGGHGVHRADRVLPSRRQLCGCAVRRPGNSAAVHGRPGGPGRSRAGRRRPVFLRGQGVVPVHAQYLARERGAGPDAGPALLDRREGRRRHRQRRRLRGVRKRTPSAWRSRAFRPLLFRFATT